MKAAAAAEVENRIRANRLLNLGVEWERELIFPYYGGLSLLNVPHTVARLFGAELPDAAPLDDVVWGGEHVYGSVDRVVLFLSDGLGYHWLNQILDEDAEVREAAGVLTGGRGMLPLTSIAPSTTVAALNTLWSGYSPAAHGILGLRMWLRELSLLGDVLFYRPVAGNLPIGVLESWGLPPETFVPVPGLAETLSKTGVRTHLVLSHDLMGTGLSRILHRGVAEHHPHASYSDFWVRIHDVLRSTAGKRAYVNIYWPAVDTLAHRYGSRSSHTRAEVKHQLLQLREILTSDDVRDGRTLVLFVADHGHVDETQQIHLGKDAAAQTIYEGLRMGYGGERRMSYLYLRDGFRQQVIESVEREYADGLAWVDAELALSAGLLGGGKHHPEVLHRLGDLIVFSRAGWQVNDPLTHRPFASTHGGLSENEMFIPLLWSRI